MPPQASDALLQQLLAHGVNSLMAYFHLRGEVLFKPLVLVDIAGKKSYGESGCDLHGGLSDLAVVEPRLCPPPYAGAVVVDADNPRYVYALREQRHALERIAAAGRNGIPAADYSGDVFFFEPSRPMPCLMSI